MTDKDNKIINLDKRLLQCANFVRNGVNVVDVGTDHAYLSIYLVKTQKVKHAIASDLREGPLQNAVAGIKNYNCDGFIETRLSDGLSAIKSCEADDIVIAGMGGEVISQIIENAQWLKDENKHLILQPMTMAEHLRRFLFKEGFEILKESAVCCGNKVYTVMLVAFTREGIHVSSLYPYIGGLEHSLDNCAMRYIEKQIRDLSNKIRGHNCQGEAAQAESLGLIKCELEKLINGSVS